MGAGSQINSYGVGDVQADSIMETLDKTRLGYHALTLTEFDTTTRPAIAAGSKIEINGALFEFTSESVISGTPADGAVYILLTVASTSVTASFTAVAPTWSDSKQGWYGTGGNANFRYANFKMTKAGALYSNKSVIPLSKTTDLIFGENGDITGNDITCNDITAAILSITAMETQSIASNGYMQIGSLQIRWGYFSGSTDGSKTKVFTYPTAFSTANFVHILGKAAATSNYYVSAKGATTVTITSANTSENVSHYYIAIGN